LNNSIPKISIFIPIYNKQKYLKRCIDSIQNQTLKDIEIIAVNDHSNDSSLEIIKEYSKNDSRIIIINNNNNYGLLYSRAMGVYNSKGEYIMNVDPDDELEGADNLEYLYNKAKKSKVDIISFATLYKSNEQITIKCSKFHKIYRQPLIFESAFNSNNNLIDFLIWNKLIRREIYLKAYEFFRPKIYGEKWNYHEDNIWSILVNKYAKTMICVNKLIYIYNDFKDSLMKNRYDLIELNNLIYRHFMYKEIFTTQKENKYLIAEYLELINFIEESDNFYQIIKNNDKIRIQLFKIFINFTENYSCSVEVKQKIKIFLNKIY
jgi:glycosyltransferase involved in cell wall biosynthesis